MGLACLIFACICILAILIGVAFSNNNKKRKKIAPTSKSTTKSPSYDEPLKKKNQGSQSIRPYDMDSKIASRVESYMISHEYKKTLFVLHTSCVKSCMTDLNELFLNPYIPSDCVKYVLPKNVYNEVRLLSETDHYSRQSNIVLDNCEHTNWSLQQLYNFTDTNLKIKFEKIKSADENLVFIFNDSAAFDEFIKYVESEDNVYVINLDRNIRGYERIIQPLYNFREYYTTDEKNGWKKSNRYRKAFNPGERQETSELPNSERIFLGYPNSNRKMRMESLESIKAGGEAIVYSLPDNEDTLVKIYTNTLPDDRKERKLQWLIDNKGNLPFEHLALPEELVYNHKGKCIGFTMCKISAESLGDKFFAKRKWNSEQYKVVREKRIVVKNLSKLLLELQMAGVFVADLSLNNILVDCDNNVYLIDCDSFEVARYPGEGVTNSYRHPNLTENRDLLFYLREPRIHTFSYAVVVYQIYLSQAIHPLLQCSDEDEIWGVQKFPYNYEECESFASPYVTEKWKESLNRQERALFTEEFRFKTPHGIGDWICDFKLLN